MSSETASAIVLPTKDRTDLAAVQPPNFDEAGDYLATQVKYETVVADLKVQKGLFQMLVGQCGTLELQNLELRTQLAASQSGVKITMRENMMKEAIDKAKETIRDLNG